MLIEGVDLLGDLAFLEEEGGLVLFGDEDDSLAGDDADGGAGLVDGLDGVLELLEAAVGRESGGLGVVPSGHLNYF